MLLCYFHPHSLSGFLKVKKQVKKQSKESNLNLVILELHFDGYNGDCLLVYVPTNEKVFLTGIGTHSELFK
ncbi:hypothetical protein KIMC2_12760 [Xylocopilactobacillus apis]|uniref:Uncharacterized protein n=2 Tax=Xylocopilactobacillus apis TaxID=2932183 RepID=A0AAU9CRZ3_9LACO|nr:hypothetical protein KIMC2_12760 [Xylocopilactobacillus apis]